MDCCDVGFEGKNDSDMLPCNERANSDWSRRYIFPSSFLIRSDCRVRTAHILWLSERGRSGGIQQVWQHAPDSWVKSRLWERGLMTGCMRRFRTLLMVVLANLFSSTFYKFTEGENERHVRALMACKFTAQEILNCISGRECKPYQSCSSNLFCMQKSLIWLVNFSSSKISALDPHTHYNAHIMHTCTNTILYVSLRVV